MGINEAKELNELLKAQNKLYEDQNKLLNTQMGMMQQLVNTLNRLDLERAQRSVENLNSAAQNAANTVEQLGQGQQTMQSINNAAEEAADNMDSLAASAESFGRKLLKMAPAIAMFKGFTAGLKFTKNAMFGLIKTSVGVTRGLFNIGAAIISVPWKMLTGLMEMAAQGGGGELRQAIEDVRKEFGDLAQNESRAVMQSWRQLDHFGGRLAETNLSIWRTMGNMAESLKRVHEMATALGPVFSSFTAEFRERKGVERLHAYQKGLGLTDEGFRAMGEQAARAGVSIQEMGRQITSVAYAMGESFGINGKLIGREIGKMIDDFDHFGNIGVTELAQVAVYARKLGIEVEKLTGVLDQFADFDKAAESVAQLSQAFGIQLDTLKLVQEQDPAANIERLRKAFFATGRTIETMTRQERALLATHTGLDQKTLSMVFSAQKQGMTYEEIQKGGENAEKQQLSQAEAMQKLSNSIERLVRSGQTLDNDFFTIFMKGFMRGVRWTREWWGLMWNLRRAMWKTRYAGMKVGQMFVKYFPGVKDIFKGISDIFNPRRFQKMLNGVVKAFREFFINMTKNPQQALPVLLDKLKKTFFDWFSASTPSGRRIIDGFKSFFKGISQIFASLTVEAIKGTTKIFHFIADVFKDPSKAFQSARQAGGGILGFLAEVLSPFSYFFTTPEGINLLKGLWESFARMMKEIWKRVQPAIAKMMPYLFGGFFGPAFIVSLGRGITTALGVAFVKGVGNMIKGSLFKKGAAQLANATSHLTSKGVSKLAEIATNVSSKMPANGARNINVVSAAAKAASDANKSTKGFGAKDAAALGLKLLAIAGALSLGGIAMAASLVAVKAILKSGGINSVKDAVLPITIMAAATGGIALMSLAIKSASTIVNPSLLLKSLIGMVAIFGMLTLTMWGFKKLYESSRDIGIEQIKQTAIGLGAMSMVMVAGAAFAVGAAAVGALILSVGGAIAMVAGMAALGVITTMGVEHTKEIMEQVNSLPTVNESKLSAFTTVIKALGSFAGNIASVIDASTPSFMSLAVMPWGRKPEVEAKATIGMVADIIYAMGTEVENVINTIAGHLQNLNPEQLDQSEKMASLISTLVGLVEAMKPDTELTEGFFGDLLSVETIAAAGSYFERVSHTIPGLMNGTIGILQRVNELPPIDESKIKTFGSFIKSVGTLITAITPSGGTLGIFAAAEGLGRLEKGANTVLSGISEVFGGSGTVSSTNYTEIMFGIMDRYIQKVLSVISDGSFLNNIQEFITSMGGIAENLDENQIKSLESVSGIFTTLVDVIKSIANSFTSENFVKVIASGPGMNPAVIQSVFNNLVEGIITPIKRSIPDILNSLSELAKNMPNARMERITSIVEIMGGLFGVIPTLVEAIDKLGEGGTNIESGRAKFDARLQGVKDLFSSMFGGTEGSIVDSIKKLGEVTIKRAAKTNIERLSGIFEATSKLSELINSGLIRHLSGGGERIRGIHAFFGHLFNPNWANSQSGHWINHIKEFGETTIPRRVTSNMEQINAFVTGVSSIDFGMIARQAEAAEQIDEAMGERLKAGIKALIANTNEVGKKLKGASRRAYNINSELQSFANNLGLRDAGQLKIAHQPIQFNVNWKVTVDSEELENVLVRRNGSSIVTNGE